MGVVMIRDEPIAVNQFTKTVADAGTPEALTATATYFSRAICIGNKAARTPNVGTVYLGALATNDTQPIAIASGATYVLEAPVGKMYDFRLWYLDVVTNADGLVISYS